MEAAFTLGKEDRQRLQESLARLLAGRGEILFAYLFGSFVHDPGFHDLDAGIYLREDVLPSTSPDGTLGYETALGIDLEKNLGYPVDVKVLNHAPVALCHAVTNGLVLLSRNEEARFSWVEGTWDRYLDMRHFFRSSLLDLLGVE
ncbi:MAG: nucleotidyltransferase domain-containing protein [Peptococcaceae bacterium]|jgi:predicted nucleotidyltransferase|nr:nucleotidyltransferase domain-containing protein [Peptococcaceae bacterium]